jgi:hypothetical protein
MPGEYINLWLNNNNVLYFKDIYKKPPCIHIQSVLIADDGAENFTSSSSNTANDISSNFYGRASSIPNSTRSRPGYIERCLNYVRSAFGHYRKHRLSRRTLMLFPWFNRVTAFRTSLCHTSLL